MTLCATPLRCLRALVRYLLPGLVVTASAFSIWFLSVDTLDKIDEMQVAQSDNVAYGLSRIEVEFLQFRRRIDVTRGPDDLAELRRMFDVFYSRIQLVGSAPVYEVMRDQPEYIAAIEIARDFITDTATLMDSSDDVLLAALPRIDAAADRLQPHLRDMSLIGLRKFSAISDARRESLLSSTQQLALVTSCLIVLLILLATRTALLARRNAIAARFQQETAERLSTIIATSLDAVLVIDAKGRIVEYNGAAQGLFGYSAEEATGQPVRMLVPDQPGAGADTSEARFLDLLARRTLRRGRVEIEARHQSGARFPIELSASVTGSGEALKIVAFVRDITERLRNEAELIEARDRALAGETAKASFFAVMSHEMRTPMNGVLGTLSLLRDTRLTRMQERMIASMEVSGRLLLQHINDVLEISRFDAGHIRPVAAPFRLDRMIEDLVGAHEALAKANGNRIEVVWRDAPPLGVIGDQVRLSQVLVNFLSNAIKFTHKGRITVEVANRGRAGDRALFEFSVTDEGIGIDDADIERIFENFVTLDGSYTRSAGGTGLGLGIARRMAEMMGGSVGARSRKGKGSTFWARLPLPVDDADAEDATHSRPKQAARPLRLLVVEDNEINREVMTGMLKADGHSALTANDGAQGVEAAMAPGFDAILMDVSMPVMDGIEATRRIRAGDGPSKAIPIYAVTAHALPEEIEVFRAAGVTDCLTKPLDRARLREVLVEVAGRCPAAAPVPDQVAAPAADPATAPAPGGPVEPAQFASLRDSIGADETRTLLTRFIDDTDQALGPMTEGRAASMELPALSAAAHRISGAAGLFGAVEFRAVLGRIQTDGKAGRDAEARSHLDGLPAVWQRTRSALIQLGG